AAQSLATLRTAPTAWMHRSAEDRAAPAENVSKLPAESEQADAAESNVAPAWRTAEFRVSASGQRVWLIRLRQQPRGFLLDSPIRTIRRPLICQGQEIRAVAQRGNLARVAHKRMEGDGADPRHRVLQQLRQLEYAAIVAERVEQTRALVAHFSVRMYQ